MYLPPKTNSVDRYLDVTDRHLRLCARIPGGAKYADSIRPYVVELEGRLAAFKSTKRELLHAYDEKSLCNTWLNEGIRTSFETCKQHDRKNPDDVVLRRIFTDEKYSPVIKATRLRKIKAVKGIEERIIALGEGHPVFPIAQEINNLMTQLLNAESLFEEKILDERAARENMAIAKMELRQQYADNLHNARKERGWKKGVEMFPRLEKKIESLPEPTSTVNEE